MSKNTQNTLIFNLLIELQHSLCVHRPTCLLQSDKRWCCLLSLVCTQLFSSMFVCINRNIDSANLRFKRIDNELSGLCESYGKVTGVSLIKNTSVVTLVLNSFYDIRTKMRKQQSTNLLAASWKHLL